MRTVAQTPSVTAPQTEVSAATAESVTLSVTAGTADGGKLTYQWYKITDDGSEEVAGGTSSSYTFQTPSDKGWTALKYRVTVTNTLTLADGKTLTARNSVDFTVREDNRPPMPTPSPSISVRVADSDGKERGEKNVSLSLDTISNAYNIGIQEDYLIEVTVPNYDGGEISCQWTGVNLYPETNPGPTPQPVPQQFETTGSSNSIVYSLQWRFDEAPPVHADGQCHYQYTIEITSTDPDGIRRPTTSVLQFEIQVQLPLTIRFAAGKGTFSDGKKQKQFSIPWEILRSRPDDSSEHRDKFYFNREDFSDWMKEIGMHKDVIGNAISSSDGMEFDDWMCTNAFSQLVPWNSDYRVNYSYPCGPMNLENEKHITTFTAKWHVDDELLEKMNNLFTMEIPTIGAKTLKAYKAEYSDEEDKTRVYYDVELVNVEKTTGDMRTVTAVDSWQEQKIASTWGINSGMISVKVGANPGLSYDEYYRYRDKEGHYYINILPTANCNDAAEEDIAVFYTKNKYAPEYYDVFESRIQGGPAGYFVYRLEPGHSYRIEFCLYIDHAQRKYGVEYFRWNDTAAPSAKACMYVPGYAVKKLNSSYDYAFDFSKTMPVDSMIFGAKNGTQKGNTNGTATAPNVSVDRKSMEGISYSLNFDSNGIASHYYSIMNVPMTLAVEPYYSTYPIKMSQGKIQWYKNGIEIPGAQSVTYTAADYRVGDQYSILMYSIAENGDTAWTKFEFPAIVQGDACFDPRPFTMRFNSGASDKDEYTLLDNRFDFDKEKIYLHLYSSSYSYSNTSNWYYFGGRDGRAHLETLNLEIFGLSEDGARLAEADGEKGISYHSFEEPVHIEPTQSADYEIIKNIYKNTASYRPSKDLRPSTEEKDEPGFTLTLKDGYYPNFILRLDVTEVPPRIQILEAP
ncbi:MAG: hypothetical protein K2H09_01055 [Treponemataceae bacterium]|nr:hypothetical protein [Treponemataceae bacterium]